jgi:ribosomal protein L27
MDHTLTVSRFKRFGSCSVAHPGNVIQRQRGVVSYPNIAQQRDLVNSIEENFLEF